MREFELTMRIRNNLIKKRRLSRGWSQAQLASAACVDLRTAAEYERLSRSPLNARWGSWKASALAIANALGCAPDDLWPDEVLSVLSNTVTSEFSHSELMSVVAIGLNPDQAPSPLEQLESASEHAVKEDIYRRALAQLNAKERMVHSWLYVERKPASALALRLGCSRSNVYLIEERLTHKMRGIVEKLRSEPEPARRCDFVAKAQEAWAQLSPEAKSELFVLGICDDDDLRKANRKRLGCRLSFHLQADVFAVQGELRRLWMKRPDATPQGACA